MSWLGDLPYVFAGGTLGTLTRFGIAEGVRLWTRLPGWVATVTANLAGCLFMGFAFLWLTEPDRAAPLLGRASLLLSSLGATPQSASMFLLAGYCGGLTTFSAYALDAVVLFQQGKFAQSLLSGVGSVVLGTLFVALGGLAAGGLRP